MDVNEMLAKANEELVKLRAEIATGQKTAEDVVKESAELKVKIGEIEAKGKDLEAFKQGIQMQIDAISEMAQGKSEGKSMPTLEEELKSYQPLIDGAVKQGTRASFEIKAVGPMVGSTYFNGNLNDFSTTNKVGDIRQNPLAVLPYVTSTPISGGESFFVEETGGVDGTAFKADGTAAGQSDIIYSIVRQPLCEVSTYLKVSKNKINDIPWLSSKIQNNLYSKIERKADDQMYGGTAAAGVSYDGLTTIATALTATQVGATRIPSANNFSVLSWAYGWLSQNGKCVPNAILLNPIDYAVMTATLSSSQTGVIQLGLGVDPKIFKPSPKVTAGSFVIADMSVVEREFNNGIQIDIYNQNENDALTGLITVVATARHSFFVKTVNKPCIAKGTFATLITALTAA